MAKRQINPEELPSNSIAATREPVKKRAVVIENNEIDRRPRRAVRTRATIKKKSFVQSIAQALVGDSQDVGGYIVNDVLIPAFKNTVQEMVTTGIEMLLFGERRSTSRTRDRGATKVSYGSYYKDRERVKPIARRGDRFNLSEIYFEHGADADEVLGQMCDHLEDYEQVSVREYFDLAGIEGATWAHDKFGWTDLRNAHCTHTRYGYTIVLPDPIELD